jgi:alanine racemase
MVKADAYGLGAIPVARALEAVDPWGYGVASVEEGRELRGAGITRPILVATPILPSSMGVARDNALIPLLGDPDVIDAWSRRTSNAPWHLAIDTGMSRSGLRWDRIESCRGLLDRCPPAGVSTHFLEAEGDGAWTSRQLARFEEALEALPTRPGVQHAENSAAVERLTGRSRWTFARPGVFLYGVPSRAPDAGESPAALVPEPVVGLYARIVELRSIAPGDVVSYGATYRAPTARRIATVAAGYADGYRRAFGNRGEALIGRHRVPVVGVVTMDMTMLDVTDVRCAIGDAVTLLGPASRVAAHGASGPSIDLPTAAKAAGVFSYELLTGLKLRLPRMYLD